jgi:group I intron endonuclease
MSNNFYVYKITNLVNGKIYIGKTNDIMRRWKEHINHAKAGKPYPIHRAIAKYGIDSFSKEIIGTFTDEVESLQAEIKFIAQYQSNNNEIGYNLTVGGESIVGYIFTDEAKRKISEAKKGKGIGKPFYGNGDAATRQRVSKMFRGENGPNSKLKDWQVIEIKKMILDGLSCVKIAKIFGVGKSAIADIRRGRCWTHIKI